jgi:Cu-processing system ATP-binding protein
MIEISRLNKSFGKFQALNDVTLSLQSGQSIALIGPNGSGKTTIIKCLLGLVIPDSGDISFENRIVSGTWDYRKHIGYMPQIGRYPDHMSVRQLFNMIRDMRQGEQEDLHLYNEFKIDLIRDKMLGSLSGGMKQKVNASLAFLFSPKALVLDEPTAGLDPISSEILKEKIAYEKSQGKLILVTSHVLSDLEELVSDIIFIQEGKIHFIKTISAIKIETGEKSLSKAIASLMRS